MDGYRFIICLWIWCGSWPVRLSKITSSLAKPSGGKESFIPAS